MSDSNVTQFDTNVLRTVRQAAKRSHDAHRGFVEHDDLVQEGFMYVLENADKVQGWVDEKQIDLLRHAIYQHLHKYTMRQRYLKDGTKPEDYYVYQFAVIEELLPEALGNVPNYGTSSSDLNTQVKSGKSPAEGGDRMAMIADLKAAMLALSVDDRVLMVRKFYGPGMTDHELAQWLEVPEPTVNKRVRAALRKMAKALGSEPVYHRKVMSNAQAQHVTKEQA